MDATLHIDPELSLALFIAPALLDAAFDLPPRTMRRNWLPLLSLAAVLVFVTTGAVAYLGVRWAGMPVAAAIALGAIVAPPDAAAAVAVLGRFSLPHVTVQVLMGASLLNDASALLVFNFAVRAVMGGETAITWLALSVPGGVLFGLAAGYLYVAVQPKLAGSLGGVLFQFAATFGTWIVASRLHLSAILAVVVYGMIIARYVPARTTPRMRVSSYAVWESAVFLTSIGRSSQLYLPIATRSWKARTEMAEFDLERFVTIQNGAYDEALAELRRGRKENHWMWFVFPQIAGLGNSPMAKRYAIASLDEAKAYLAHPVLGARLVECVVTINSISEKTAVQIFGGIDAMKLRSSLTLFMRAAPDNPIFAQALKHYFDGQADASTDERI